MHLFHQTRRPVVVVAVTSGVDAIFHLLTTATSTCNMGEIMGVLAVDPTHNDLVPFLPPSVPVLVVHSGNGDHQSPGNQQLYMNHPNIIWVQHEVHVVWEEATRGEISELSTIQHTFWIWLLRTIAKYSEALALLHLVGENRPSTDERKSRWVSKL